MIIRRRLYTIATNKSKISTRKGNMTGKAFMETLDFDFLIKHEINHLFVVKPTFQK